MNVAEYLVKKLKNNGVNHAFGIPGGVIIDFLYALDKEDGIYPHLSNVLHLRRMDIHRQSMD